MTFRFINIVCVSEINYEFSLECMYDVNVLHIELLNFKVVGFYDVLKIMVPTYIIKHWKLFFIYKRKKTISNYYS